jgi:hypothetical protein
MKNFDRIMRVVAIAIILGLMTLTTYNAVAYGTSHDELVITD